MIYYSEIGSATSLLQVFCLYQYLLLVMSCIDFKAESTLFNEHLKPLPNQGFSPIAPSSVKWL